MPERLKAPKDLDRLPGAELLKRCKQRVQLVAPRLTSSLRGKPLSDAREDALRSLCAQVGFDHNPAALLARIFAPAAPPAHLDPIAGLRAIIASSELAAKYKETAEWRAKVAITNKVNEQRLTLLTNAAFNADLKVPALEAKALATEAKTTPEVIRRAIRKMRPSGIPRRKGRS